MTNEQVDAARVRQLAELSELPRLSPLVLCAPNTVLDPRPQSGFPVIPRIVLGYLKRNVANALWLDHLTLLALIALSRNIQESSVYSMLSLMHKRLLGLSRARSTRFADMKSFNENIDECMRLYLSRVVLTADSTPTRHSFYSRYQGMAELSHDWLMSIPAALRQQYAPLLFAGATRALHSHLLNFREIERQQKQNRKVEVDALMPVYPDIRREVHLRFNRIARLKYAYDEFLAQHTPPDSGFLRFVYLEDGLEFEFQVWSLNAFSRYVELKTATVGLPSVIMQLIRIVNVADGVEADVRDLLWFYDLIRLAVIRQKLSADADALQWLKSWGYTPSSFKSQPGILSWSASAVMCAAQKKVEGFLVPIPELYSAAAFGLLAIDLFTTTGIRLNEALQISLDKDCFVRLTIPRPPGAEPRAPTIRYSIRVVPKGDRSNRREDNFIGEETKRILVKVAQMLSQQYGLSGDQSLPLVQFDPNHRRAHRFGRARYIFQMNHAHLSGVTLSSCIRFMMHGMDIRTADGRAIAVRPHLLRHGFATHAVQVEKIPVDIVGRWLHQKSVEVTGYYSQPTETMIADAADRYLSVIAAHIDVKSAVERSPDNLKRLYEESASRTGTLALVVGGACGSHGLCRSQLACIGCAAKVPDPEKRDQVLHQRDWATRELKFYRDEGLMPAARRLELLIKNADAELREMDQIEEFRADEGRKGTIEVKN